MKSIPSLTLPALALVAVFLLQGCEQQNPPGTPTNTEKVKITMPFDITSPPAPKGFVRAKVTVGP